jgi:Zn-dependent peptidase ImmA (M78 family)
VQRRRDDGDHYDTIDRGFYYFADGRHYMALSSKLTRTKRNFIGWHEFAHCLQNYHARKPIAAFSDVEPDKASEKLADIFAMIALRPEDIKITRPLDFLRMILETEYEH